MPTQQVLRWTAEIRQAARTHAVDPGTLIGIVQTESSGNPWAVRIEPTFWRKYEAGIRRAVAGKDIAKWINVQAFMSASYGLCQIMLPVAVEQGWDAKYPTALCDPEVNLDLGAKILANHLMRVGGDLRAALLRYNGGGDAAYPDRVMGAAILYREHVST